jgi:hypothetical protein
MFAAFSALAGRELLKGEGARLASLTSRDVWKKSAAMAVRSLCPATERYAVPLVFALELRRQKGSIVW